MRHSGFVILRSRAIANDVVAKCVDPSFSGIVALIVRWFTLLPMSPSSKQALDGCRSTMCIYVRQQPQLVWKHNELVQAKVQHAHE